MQVKVTFFVKFYKKLIKSKCFKNKTANCAIILQVSLCSVNPFVFVLHLKNKDSEKQDNNVKR